MLVNIGDYGEVEAVATARTLVIFEQEFGGGDLVGEVFGRHEGSDDGSGGVVIDFTSENWLSELKALWAMVCTAYEIAYDRGDAAPNARPARFGEWVKGVGKLNMRDVSTAVVAECIDGFFHSGAAASE